MKKKGLKYYFLVVGYFFVSLYNQLAASFSDWLVERKQREYFAMERDTGGKTPLGKCNMWQAIEKTQKSGSVIHTDPVNGYVFYVGKGSHK